MQERMREKKVAFFIYSNRDINTYPSVTNAVRILTENGFWVDVYINPAMKTSLEIKNAHFIVTGEDSRYAYFFAVLEKVRQNTAEYIYYYVFSFEDLLISYFLNRGKERAIPSCYFSLELVFRNYIFQKKFIINQMTRLLRNIKYVLSRKISLKDLVGELNYFALQIYGWINIQFSGKNIVPFSIVQDAERGNILKREFRFISKVFYVPNSYLDFYDRKTDFAYTKFNISRDKKIILYTGGIEEGFDLALFDISKTLPYEYVLFFHAYSRDKYLDKVIPMYEKEISEGRIFISQDNLSEEDYDQLVRSCHMGIVWYSKKFVHIENIYYMGLSSGKLNKYLSCGKPVIAPDYLHSYRGLVEGNNIGRVYDEISGIPGLVEEIEKRYSEICRDVRNFYEDKIEFRKAFSPVIEEMSNESFGGVVNKV